MDCGVDRHRRQRGDPPKLSSPFWSLKPHQKAAFFESITDTVGTTTAMVIGVLGIVIVGLVIFLLFTRAAVLAWTRISKAAISQRSPLNRLQRRLPQRPCNQRFLIPLQP